MFNKKIQRSTGPEFHAGFDVKELHRLVSEESKMDCQKLYPVVIKCP